MSRGALGLLLAAGLVSCGGRGPLTVEASASPAVTNDEAEISRLIASALTAEATGQDADTLYAPGAIVVMNGRSRPDAPRLAAVATGGRVAVTSSRMEIRQGLAWALVDYRWESASDALVREGQATVIAARQRDGKWRIVHLHSSSPR